MSHDAATPYVMDIEAFKQSMQLAQEHAERMQNMRSITDDRVLKRIENGHTTLLNELRRSEGELWS